MSEWLTSISTPSSLQSTPLLFPLPLPLLPHQSNIILQLIHIGKVASTSRHTGRVLTTESTASPSWCSRGDSPWLLLCGDWGRRSDRNGSRGSSSGLLSGLTVESLHWSSADGEVGVSRRSSSVVGTRVMPHYYQYL
jgi:hypothetical protein